MKYKFTVKQFREGTIIVEGETEHDIDLAYENINENEVDWEPTFDLEVVKEEEIHEPESR